MLAEQAVTQFNTFWKAEHPSKFGWAKGIIARMFCVHVYALVCRTPHSRGEATTLFRAEPKKAHPSQSRLGGLEESSRGGVGTPDN